MFRAIATLASFTLIGGLLYKYNEEIFAEMKKLNPNGNAKALKGSNNAASPKAYEPESATNKRA